MATNLMQFPRKVYLGSYPYTYARVSAMKGSLLRRQDYDKLLKMRVQEIVKFLQESDYKKEIDEIGGDFSLMDKIELGLNRNLQRVFNKLKRISDGNLRLLIAAYLHRKDIANVKTVLRGKLTSAATAYVESLLVPAGLLSEEYFRQLLRKNTIEEIAKSVTFVDLTAATAAFKKTGSLFEMENQLDRYYYDTLLDLSRRIPEQGILFKAFLENEIDVLNIKNILHLKHEGMKPQDIELYIFFSPLPAKNSFLRKLTRASDVGAALSILKKHGYGRLAEGEEKLLKDKSLIEIEAHLYHYLLDKAVLLLHQNPLSVDVILGYMLAKELEVRNLKILLKGKQVGLEEALLEKQLIVHK